MAEADKRWLANVTIPIPVLLAVTPQGDPGAPVQRVREQRRAFNGTPVVLRPEERTPQTPFGIEPASLTMTVSGPDFLSAIQAVADVLAPLIGSLSFQVQSALEVGSSVIKDVTEPVSEGDEREVVMHAGGFPMAPFRRVMVGFGDTQPVVEPRLDIDLQSDDQLTPRALDWYLKSLAAILEAERFICLWVATELLWKSSDIEVVAPQSCRFCRKELGDCPHCGKLLNHPSQGKGIVKFLVEHWGCPEERATEIWRTRQILHGDFPFDSARVADLGNIIEELRPAVVGELKERFGLPQAEPPLAGAPQFSVGGGALAHGTNKVTALDIEMLSLLEQ